MLSSFILTLITFPLGLEADVELAKAKAESIRQSERAEETYLKAIEALKRYSGQGEDEDYD